VQLPNRLLVARGPTSIGRIPPPSTSVATFCFACSSSPAIRTSSVCPAAWPATSCKQHRVVTTRYDKLACRYQATISNAAINGWLIPGFLNRP
jgi:hypothetical protein